MQKNARVLILVGIKFISKKTCIPYTSERIKEFTKTYLTWNEDLKMKVKKLKWWDDRLLLVIEFCLVAGSCSSKEM